MDNISFDTMLHYITESMIKIVPHQVAINFLELIKDSYVLVNFPEVQDFMEEDWFKEEAILAVTDEADSSYFIPVKRLL